MCVCVWGGGGWEGGGRGNMPMAGHSDFFGQNCVEGGHRDFFGQTCVEGEHSDFFFGQNCARRRT